MGKFFTPLSVLIISLSVLSCVYYLGEKYLDNQAKQPCSCQVK